MAKPSVPSRRERPATPRWVIALGLITLLVAVIVVMMVAGGNEHGPGRHTGGSTSGVEQDAGDAHTPS